MREKLNESKTAQIGLVAVLVVVVAVIFLGRSGGGGGGGSEAEAPVAGEAAVPTSLTAAGTGMGQLPTSVPAAKGPPRRFVAAYDANQTVALLVVHDGGIDDAYTKKALKRTASLEGVATFVVPAKQISRYATVTVGLDVNQLPALIVLRPKKLSGGVPQATVSYGYQTPESIYVSVLDATYKGPEVTYHPG